jgi:hypothetical protein
MIQTHAAIDSVMMVWWGRVEVSEKEIFGQVVKFIIGKRLSALILLIGAENYLILLDWTSFEIRERL